MICEFCRMRGHKKTAYYTVRVDGIDWELCYDDMWNEVYYMKRGKVVDSRKATHHMWAIINKVMNKWAVSRLDAKEKASVLFDQNNQYT